MRTRQSIFLLLLGLAGGAMATGCTSTFDQYAADSTMPYGVAQASYDETVELREEESSLTLADFAPSNIGATVKDVVGKGPDRDVAQQLYAEGEQTYREALAARSKDPESDAKDLFSQASDQFADAAQRWPDSALEEDALFRAAESQFFADNYVKSNNYFEQLLKKYPNTRYLDLVGARRFLIADYWLKLHATDSDGTLGFNVTDSSHPWSDTFGHAVRIFDRMRIDDATGKLADDATIAAANAYFMKGDYLKADQYYSDLRNHFPSSEHQFKAHFLGIQAKLNGYKGPDYAGDSLGQAEKLIKQVRRQFSQEAHKHQAELDRAFKKVRFLRAEREWRMAEYYNRRHEYGAARFYCEVVLKDYSDTPFAERAREQIGTNDGKPLTPPQKLAWLVKLFPDSDTQVPLMATSPGDSKHR